MRRFLLLITLLLLTSCASYEKQTQSFRGTWNSGNTLEASKVANIKVYDNIDSKDSVIWLLEQGAALRANDQLEESNYAFDRAEKRIKFYENQAKLRISKETTSLVTNLATIPYEGKGYDRVMLNTYQALNYLRLGQKDEALVELRQANAEQKKELIRNERKITSARKSTRQLNSDILQTEKDYNAQIQLRRLQPNLNLDYGPFVNPFTDFLHALCLWSLADDQSENALVSLRRIYETLGRPQFISDEIKLVDDMLSGKKHPDLTYVIFETGVAPILKEIRLDIPLYDRDLPYVATEFPRLVTRGHLISSSVATGEIKTKATMICEMDEVIGRDFKTGLPGVIIRTVASAALKASATKNAGDKNGDLGKIAGTVYQIFSTKADLRTWTTLPKAFAVTRIETPNNRKLTLLVGSQKSEIIVNAGKVCVVYVKGFVDGAPLKIHQFKLK